MTSTAAPPTSTLSPGVLVDLGEHCPPRCVTWDDAGTCWGLIRTRGRSRRPETVPYRVLAPVDDDEAWILGADVAPAPTPVGASSPPRPPARTAVAIGPSDPVGLVRAVFGDDVEVIASVADLACRVRKLLDSYAQRDPAVLDHPTWRTLAAAVDETGLVAAARGVLDWCAETDPERLKLGGWKRLAGLVEAFGG